MTNETKAEMQADIEFLANRAKDAGCIRFTDDRDTGMSSNAIVSLAYLGTDVGSLPMDMSDLNACERMWEKLPLHRKTQKVLTAMNNARQAINK